VSTGLWSNTAYAGSTRTKVRPRPKRSKTAFMRKIGLGSLKASRLRHGSGKTLKFIADSFFLTVRSNISTTAAILYSTILAN